MKEERDTFLVWLDTALLLLGGFVAMAALLLMLVNPPKPETEAEAEPPGVLMVEIRWPDNLDADIDLWVQAPGDIPVGYSSKQGRVMNLLRDDLGNYNAFGGLRYENAYSRGVPAGEYTVNVVSYRVGSVSMYPIPVKVAVSLKRDGSHSMLHIYDGQVILTTTSQETTAVRFTIDDNKQLVPNTINSVQRHVWRAE